MRTKLLAMTLAALVGACRRDPPAPRNVDDVPPCHRHRAMADASADVPRPQPIPGASVYQMDVAWNDQEGRVFHLADLRGSPAVVLMFYGTCQSVCPILISDVLRVEAALTPAARQHTRFVLVTFDPTVDTAERLRALAAERHMDTSRWTLLRGTDDDIRTLATVLGVQYSRIGPSDFTHSNLITVLDPQIGRAHV